MAGKLKNYIGKFNEIKASFRNSETQQAAIERAETLLSKESGFIINEAYKALRTNIIFTLSNIGDRCKKVIITSASPGEGKTTTCLNLSIAFAQTGSKVLLIGADLRKPRIYRHLGIERQNGLSDVLCGLIEVEDSIKKCEKYGIDCITAGQIPPNPIELLASPKMGEILDALSSKYDYIFIDTPPVTIVSDATAMSKYTDGVIVVVRQNYTIHETLEKARTTLDFAEAKILGYILNDVTNVTSRYGTYKKFGYAYSGRSIKNILGNYGYGGYGYGYGYGYGGYGYGYSDSKSLNSKETDADKFVGKDEEYDIDAIKEDVSADMFEETEEKRKKEKKKKKK